MSKPTKPTPDEIRSLFDAADDRIENLVEMDRPNRSRLDRRRAHAVAAQLAAVISQNAAGIAWGGL